MLVKDMYGQVIEKGDYINYPYNSSAGARLRVAKVLKVNLTKDHLDRDTETLTVAAIVDSEIKTLTVRRADNCVIIPKIYIQGKANYYKLIHEVVL